MADRRIEPQATEQELVDLLERQHAGAGGNGPEYAFMRQVRNDGSFDATRTFDAVAVALWRSRGYAIHVFEVKTARSDWLRELKDPAKSEAAHDLADRFTIVATRGVVQSEELPPGWGLIEAYGGKEMVDQVEGPGDGTLTGLTKTSIEGRKLRTVVKATLIKHDVVSRDRDVRRGFVVSMLRAAGATVDAQTPQQAAVERGVAQRVDEIHTAAEERWRDRFTAAERRATELTQHIRRWHMCSGIDIVPSFRASTEQVQATGKRVRAALEGDSDAARQRLQTLRDNLANQVEHLDTLLAPDTVAGDES